MIMFKIKWNQKPKIANLVEREKQLINLTMLWKNTKFKLCLKFDSDLHDQLRKQELDDHQTK